MKAKLVQYPFNEKKFEWDTQKQTREFEYTWEQSVPRNFDTITPYIKTAPFNRNTLYEENYALLGANYPMPGAEVDGTPTYTEWTYTSAQNNAHTPDCVYVYGPYGSNLPVVSKWEVNPPYPNTPGTSRPLIKNSIDDFEIAVISENNYSSFNWNLTEFNWIWDNLEVTVEEIINFIYLKKPNYKTSFGFSNEFHFIDAKSSTPIQFNLTREIVNGLKQLRITASKGDDIFDWNWTQYDHPVVKIPTMNLVHNVRGVVLIQPLNYLYIDQYNSQFSVEYKPNTPRYEAGCVFYIQLEPQIYDVYYFYGKTYDVHSIGISNPLNNIYFTNGDGESVARIGTLNGSITSNYSFNSPAIEYGSAFTWLSPEIQSAYENAYYGYRTDGTTHDCLYVPAISYLNETHHYHYIPFSMEQNSDNYYSLVPKQLVPSSAIEEIHYITGYNFNIGTTNDLTATDFRRMIKVSDWPEDLHNITLVPPFFITNAATTVLTPNLTLIGDQTNNTITVPSENTTISSYTPGEPIDRQHLNPKSVQIDAPCEYDSNGNVISYTWLTFNSYTAEEWANGYHFLGNQWNNLGSPWAYAGNMNANGDHTMTLVHCELCEPGTYINALTLLDQTDTVADDTLGNSFSTSAQTYYNNIGTMYAWWDEFVTSNNRNEYPDDGYKGLFYYILQPQKTKFIAYHINEATDELTNVELYNDRYTYTHNLTDFADHSLENTVIGTTTSTNESSIPDAYYRTYKGIYLGQSIPLLNIAEIVIDPGMILGVPVYNKQVNTSDTLKYGTVASASLTFRVDIPVDNAMVYNNKLLVAFYDFEHNGVWEPWGFFRIDTIEAQDENCTSIVAHDEVYKLNKYVDDFLKNYTGATTLDRFFKDLLDYCDCEYDPHMATINNGNLNLNNVYNATKTTGLEVAHYIANISPGFVHANMDNDIVLAQYKPTDKVKTVSDYSNLVYNAYNTDMLNKVIITMNNAVIAEDQGSGTKTYYIADNPLLSKHISEAALVLLAEKVLQKYQQIPVYRPAQIKFLTSPGLDIGDVFTVVTKNSQQYNVATMEININESGLEIKSMGIATYPVDPSSNSQFVNLVDSIDTVQVDVDDLNDAVAGLDGRVGDIETDITGLDGRIDATEADISGLKGRMTTAEGNINSINGDISSLDSRVDDVEDGLVTVANSLATKIAADSISTANDLVTAKINGTTVSNIATKAYVDNSGGLGFTPAAFIAANISITGNTSINAWYIGRYNADVNLWNGLLLPLEKYAGYSLFQATTNGVLWGLSTSDGDWHIITNGSYSVRT